MVPSLRRDFNKAFTPEKYSRFLRALANDCGTEIKFRVCETPCFVPAELLGRMAQYGIELTRQLLDSPEYLKASQRAIPAEFHVAHEDAQPMFLQVDFGLVRAADGSYQPKLVELQAFPSLYAYQPTLAREYIRSYGLPELGIFLSGLDEAAYWRVLRQVIIGDADPAETILLEIDPAEQKTLPDFLVTERRLGIATVNIRDVRQRGRELYYSHGGRERKISRIYNRCIVDELVRKRVQLPFDLRADLDVKWAGHPNWYFRISKFSIPFLKHECVPRTWFLDEVKNLSDLGLPREDILLKPLYSFAGHGIQFAPTDADIAAIPQEQRHDFILQERVAFAPAIETPHGPTQMEVRIMYLWPEGGELTPVLPLVRMGRGKMMGVDHNKNLEWVGGGAALIPL